MSDNIVDGDLEPPADPTPARVAPRIGLWRRIRSRIALAIAPELDNTPFRARIKRLEARLADIGGLRSPVARRIVAASARVPRHNRPVNLYLDFARHALELIDELRADVYVAHGVQALPAAAVLAHHTGGSYFCDVIEIPSFAARALPSRWHPTNLELLDCAFETYLRRADGLLTIGHALGEEIRALNPAVHVIPNYRPAEELVPNTLLRERCGLAREDTLVVSISTVASGFEVVLDALAALPPQVHLATVGSFAPADYHATCLARAAELGVAARLHCFEPVPYRQLTGFASSADVGLIVRDPTIPNNRISLPNRIFDYIFSTVPVCTPEIPDIAGIVRRWDMGAVVREMSGAGWAEAIAAVLARKDQMRAHAARASRELVWESLEDKLHDALGRPRRVCYLGVNHLPDNNRTMRMARSLAARGVEVVVASPPARGEAVTRNHDLPAGVRLVSVPL